MARLPVLLLNIQTIQHDCNPAGCPGDYCLVAHSLAPICSVFAQPTFKEFERELQRGGLHYIEPKDLIESGIRRIAGQYRTRSQKWGMRFPNIPAEDSQEQWESWLKSRANTSLFVVVQKEDISNEAWDVLVSDMYNRNYPSV